LSRNINNERFIEHDEYYFDHVHDRLNAMIGMSLGLFKGIYTADVFAKSLNYCSGVQQEGGERCFMILCEVALGNTKELGRSTAKNTDGDDDSDNDAENDCSKPLNSRKFQSRKAIGMTIPDPRHTITRNYGLFICLLIYIESIDLLLILGVRMPLGKLINNNDTVNRFHHIQYNEYIVYDESQVALRYLVQFRR
jgi:hypothetical protein